MNWRTSTAELARLYERSPWLYMIEWRERLDRCINHLSAAAIDGKLDPGEAFLEAEQLRRSAEFLHSTADRLEAEARRREKIAALRNVDGRTPEEAATFMAKADELESTG